MDQGNQENNILDIDRKNLTGMQLVLVKDRLTNKT